MPDLLAGNPVSPYHLLPCLENFTRSTWTELNKVYGGPDKTDEPPWFGTLWNALQDAATGDHTKEDEDQILRDYYIGKAFLTSDGAYSEGLGEFLKLQWNHSPYSYNECLKQHFNDEDAEILRHTLPIH